MICISIILRDNMRIEKASRAKIGPVIFNIISAFEYIEIP